MSGKRKKSKFTDRVAQLIKKQDGSPHNNVTPEVDMNMSASSVRKCFKD